MRIVRGSCLSNMSELLWPRGRIHWSGRRPTITLWPAWRRAIPAPRPATPAPTIIISMVSVGHSLQWLVYSSINSVVILVTSLTSAVLYVQTPSRGMSVSLSPESVPSCHFLAHPIITSSDQLLLSPTIGIRSDVPDSSPRLSGMQTWRGSGDTPMRKSNDHREQQ